MQGPVVTVVNTAPSSPPGAAAAFRVEAEHGGQRYAFGAFELPAEAEAVQSLLRAKLRQLAGDPGWRSELGVGDLEAEWVDLIAGQGWEELVWDLDGRRVEDGDGGHFAPPLEAAEAAAEPAGAGAADSERPGSAQQVAAAAGTEQLEMDARAAGQPAKGLGGPLEAALHAAGVGAAGTAGAAVLPPPDTGSGQLQHAVGHTTDAPAVQAQQGTGAPHLQARMQPRGDFWGNALRRAPSTGLFGVTLYDGKLLMQIETPFGSIRIGGLRSAEQGAALYDTAMLWREMRRGKRGQLTNNGKPRGGAALRPPAPEDLPPRFNEPAQTYLGDADLVAFLSRASYGELKARLQWEAGEGEGEAGASANSEENESGGAGGSLLAGQGGGSSSSRGSSDKAEEEEEVSAGAASRPVDGLPHLQAATAGASDSSGKRPREGRGMPAEGGKGQATRPRGYLMHKLGQKQDGQQSERATVPPPDPAHRAPSPIEMEQPAAAAAAGAAPLPVQQRQPMQQQQHLQQSQGQQGTSVTSREPLVPHPPGNGAPAAGAAARAEPETPSSVSQGLDPAPRLSQMLAWIRQGKGPQTEQRPEQAKQAEQAPAAVEQQERPSQHGAEGLGVQQLRAGQQGGESGGGGELHPSLPADVVAAVQEGFKDAEAVEAVLGYLAGQGLDSFSDLAHLDYRHLLEQLEGRGATRLRVNRFRAHLQSAHGLALPGW